MSFTFLVVLFYVKLISAEWVKLPNISPTTQVPKVVFKLAQPIKNSFLSSETLKSVISLPSTTTETSFFGDNISTRKSYVRQYFHTTVTSHVLNVLGNLSNVTKHEELLEPVHLHAPEKNKNRVIYFNKTVQMNVIPVKTYQIMNVTDYKLENNNENVNYQENDDDGMTISENTADDLYYDDEYYYEYADETTKFNPFTKKEPSTTTTVLPPKTHKKKTLNQKLQRRTMIQMMNSKQYKPFGDVSFPSFIKFLRKIQESFAIRTAKTIGDKIKMLVTFRDQLMMTINKQIRRLWRGNQASSKKSSSNKRSKRTLGLDHGHGSGAMDFPSAEGALLSICFLTFAVFLIKLVLVSIFIILFHKSFNHVNNIEFQQVIQTIKMKKAMWATQMMMGTENVVIKRQKRSTDDDLQKLVNIYDSIEKLRLKY